MADKEFPNSGLPIRKTVELLPSVFRTDANDKFMSAVVDPLVQPGVLEKLVGYVGRRYGKTYKSTDIYLDSDPTLRSRYQLEPGVVVKNQDKIESFYDYIDLKNQLKFFGNLEERDDLVTSQDHYSWNPPIDWDKFVNYREYYWVPEGPPSVPVLGQTASVVSTYKVKLGVESTSFIFTPDGLTNNPAITLYRGQTYKFRIDAPNEGFVIRRSYDTGALTFDPDRIYRQGQLAVYDSKLWRVKATIIQGDGSTIDLESEDWEYVSDATESTALDYNTGVTNNRIENGTLTFEVPYDAPDILFYQGLNTPDRFGRFIISDIESNTDINIEKDIIGKPQYTSSNGIEFTNGLVVEFLGRVTPEKYSTNFWLVEGVGTAITLTKFNDLVVPVLTAGAPEVLFDNEGFDTQPFDDAAAYPAEKDYILINRASIDSNPWSRYNRWFHREVLDYSFRLRGDEFSAAETARAKRPIIEFQSSIQLFNHGAVAKQVVDYIDDYTDDVFSKIEGSVRYNVDSEFIFEGARILFTADTDSLANNKIYRVSFITHNNRRQIALREEADSESLIGQGVLIRRGAKNGGLMYHFNGTSWVKSQPKTKVNQPPLFDAFDENGDSFSDTETYPVSSFKGTQLVGYRLGSGPIDTELGFAISYLNIDNVGDIQFDWNWEVDEFEYTLNQTMQSRKVSTGYYKVNPLDTYLNGWIKTNQTYIQPILDSGILAEATNVFSVTSIDWEQVTDDTPLTINFYRNGIRIYDSYTRVNGTFTFENEFDAGDVISLKIITTLDPDTGYYEMPMALEKNPLNDSLITFTLGQAIDHIVTAMEFDTRFVGTIPGTNNLRDLNEFQQYAKRFMKHSGVAPVSVGLLCDKTNNIIKSLQYAKYSYTEFKNTFLTRATELEFNDNIVEFVDDIISDITKTKTVESPFADSDMIGSGAYTTLLYTVEDTGIKTFSLSQKFSLTELSRRAVYVYINNQQLLNSVDYEFNPTFGFVIFKGELAEGDEIEIREYTSTASNHIPPTPTSMGLYKKYTPMKFLDNTYREPKEVIQGHDGSISVAYGDYRDDLLLELEYRIYNNIKQEYNETVFDIDLVTGGYYGNSLYNKEQLDTIVAQEFLKWIQNTNINYTENEWFVENETFTYTYSNMTDPAGTVNLPGYWRGVYQWFYDTDRPHRCPWEMLGFSEQPTWWEARYGAAPYTKNNLILWEDLRDGIIREGIRAGTYDRYKRPSLLSHIPVDGDGLLLSPLDSGLAGNFTLINNRGPFKLGDVNPVEYAWRSSSEWPFAVAIAMCLLKPFEFITDSLDRSRTKVNKIGQTVNVDTNTFFKLEDIVVPRTGGILSAGLIKYLVGYAKSRGISLDSVEDKIQNIDVQLSSRLSGFVDKSQQRYILDSKNPKAASSSIFVPQENYDIIFNVSAPIASATYSGVVLEKTEGGWIVTGYDDIAPYFNYYTPQVSQKDPLISIGGVSANFSEWAASTNYQNGQVVRYRTMFYRALQTHESNTTFDETFWKKLPKLPVIGAVEAYRRRTFNGLSQQRLSYGTKLNTIQQVVDFLLGYEAYLKVQGFVFDDYDTETQTPRDWTTSCKEFMFWTKHNWAIGSLITLSPSAERVEMSMPVGVADNILDGFYNYQLLKGDGQPLAPQYINVNRSFQRITVETTNTTDGIYYLKLYYVLKEHVTVFDDRTVFNDVIYDKTTGYRQDRIKASGFRTVDWDGDYTSPGFIFDNVTIQVWQPFTDYRLGDIVAYRSYNWTSLVNQLGSAEFDDSKWTKLDSTPEKQLVANFDYRINQMEDYYDVSFDGIGETQRALARHAVGYQTRDYLQSLSEDSVTQFQLYQGFIREKGTNNSLTKVFDKLSRSGDSSISLNEEWAFRVGRFGGVDQLKELEIQLEKPKFQINPQPLLTTVELPNNITDQYYRIPKAAFTIAPVPYELAINPTSYDAEPTKTAGYVHAENIERVVATRDDILNLNINTFTENDHVWVTFDSYTWTVLRFNELLQLRVSAVEKTDSSVLVTFNRAHNFTIDDIVGFRLILNLTGFYKIISVGEKTITVRVAEDAGDPLLVEGVIPGTFVFTVARYSSYQDMDEAQVALLKNNSKMWIDNNGENLWEVVQKKKQFTDKIILDFASTVPKGIGTEVVYSEKLGQTITSMVGEGFAIAYTEGTVGLTLKQIIVPPAGLDVGVKTSFGEKMAVSPDNRFLIVASPRASGIPSNFKGNYEPLRSYLADDIVLYEGRLWKALNDIPKPGGLYATEWPDDPTSPEAEDSSITVDDSTWMSVYTEDWEPAIVIDAFSTARDPGFTNQGMISIYEYANQQWELSNSFVSPRPSANEFFGSDVSIGQDGDKYYMAVSAVGSLGDKGRVYLYEYDDIPLRRVISATIVTKGSGYTTGDILTVSYLDQEVTFSVIASAISEPSSDPIEGGEIQALTVISSDIFKFITTRIVDTTVTTIETSTVEGSGCTISLNYEILAVAGWKHLENTNYETLYQGIYDSTLNIEYPRGSVVWYDGKLYQAQEDVINDGSTVLLDQFSPFNLAESNQWKQIDPISTQCSLPTNIALDDDGSTLALGLLSPNQLAELVKSGDQFGSSIAMNRDGSILVVSAIESDGQYFANYRGMWRPDVVYQDGDVVKYSSLEWTNTDDSPINEGAYSYYKLFDPREHDEEHDSSVVYTAENVLPENGDPWQVVSDSTSEASGKVYIYQRTSYGSYELKQTITAGSLADISDIGTENISSGDKFGFSIDIDYTGTTLVISSPLADRNLQNQGSVYVFKSATLTTLEYRLKQKIESYEAYPNEYFGQSVSISSATEKIVVGAKNAPYTQASKFDTGEGTVFDQGKTRFIEDTGFAGAVYVFDKKDNKYFLTEKLDTQLSPYESFGSSIDCTDSIVVVGSPFYIAPTLVGGDQTFDGIVSGVVRLFKKAPSVASWQVLNRQQPAVDLSKIRSIVLYDNVRNTKIGDIDYVDHAKLKVLNSAEQELKYKTPFDPAVYTIGNSTTIVEPSQAWGPKQVGQIWWNTSTAKWVHYEQGDLSYRIGNWNRLAEGASIDVYEWVESVLLPNEWSALADTNEGLAEGISGQPLYPNNDVYAVKVFYNALTGAATSARYYYWVRNKVTIPENDPTRRISAAGITTLINNPAGTGSTFISLIAADKFLAYNFESVLSSDTALLNIQYRKNNDKLNLIHSEYQLLTEGVADSLPTAQLETKWIDSLVGTDLSNNVVPATDLPAKLKYGVGFRPRQTMFVNRKNILRTVIDNINTVLAKEAFADTIDFVNLNLVDTAPNAVLNLYDVVVNNETELQAVGTVRVRPVILRLNLINGELDTIDIVERGFGYKVAPPLIIEGDGAGATASLSIDNQGQVISATVLTRGKKYSFVNAKVRNFSVLVNADSTINNFWSIYAWDSTRKTFFRTQSQAFDTTRYWSLVDWWEDGYGITTRIVKEIGQIAEEPTINVSIGDLIRIEEFASGGWAVFEKIADGNILFSDNYIMVGREKGTIAISALFYQEPIGYDNTGSFDIVSYDLESARELRNILKAVKEDIFTGEYAVEWNNLFFTCVRYVFSEQQYVDWAFKTSFLNATHNVGSLEQKLNYKNDNLDSFRSYIDEVKPFRTTVREYVSAYDRLDTAASATTDFDLPATYSTDAGKIVTVTTDSAETNSYPWKWWADNNGFSIVSIEIYDGGERYSSIPNVLISGGNGTGATARAYISNGRVSGIEILTGGTGYTSAPTVTIVGGNASSARSAKVVAILGDTKARTFNLGIKFDRLAKTGTFQEFTQQETFTATGTSAVFELRYAPQRDKSKIFVYLNDVLAFKDAYDISLYKSSTDSYSLLKGKLIFKQVPKGPDAATGYAGDIIRVEYEKNDELLDSINRIEKYYAPGSGMKGKDLGQLMTGIDFGGVQIQGTTFDVTGGWDALPWFTDNWDSVEAAADYYVVCDGSTINVTLPFTPAVGQEITVYLKRTGQSILNSDDRLLTDELTNRVTYEAEIKEPTTIRIDDPFFNQADDSSSSANPNAQMPTFIGDGITNTVEIGLYVSTNVGDILIFRPIESDGSVRITDPNLLDTNLSGGSLAMMSGAYSTATGKTAEEIVIDGDKFISPDQVPAPEENIPGQVLDSVSIRVFNNTSTGAAALQNRLLTSNGTERFFDIGQEILENSSLLVYVNKIPQTLNVDYLIDFISNTVEFLTAPTINSTIELISIGIGGAYLLDYQEFVADGQTDLFLTAANFVDTSRVFVTVNGNAIDTRFINSTGTVDAIGKTLVQFGIKPARRDVVKIVCIGSDPSTDISSLTVVRVNKQRLEFEGSTRTFELDGFVNIQDASAQSSIVVEVNGRVLRGPDTIYEIYDGATNSLEIGVDPLEVSSAILTNNISVFVNNKLLTFIQDYSYEGIEKIIVIDPALLTKGDIIKVENNLRSEYSIVDNVINGIYIDSSIEMASINETDNDYIDVTWFSEYPSMNITSDEYSGGKVNYVLTQTPLNAGYVWVYKNGVRLVKDIDYRLSLPRGVLYLTADTVSTDLIKIVTFGSEIYRAPSAFEIHKDMLNVYHYKRHALGEITLTTDLTYYAQSMTVSDASVLSAPTPARNIPGVVYINGERIEFLSVNGNVLSQLRRGVQGTAIAELHSAGSNVIDIGIQETLPYNETQDRLDFVSDGSTQLIGPLDFVPTKSTRTSWYRTSIPTEYGPCDTIEVFVAGTRLRKDPIAVYDELLGASSPAADRQLEAEFAVDGTSNAIYLTKVVPAGTRISVIRKTGKVWYEPGVGAASAGKTLLANNTAIAEFIAKRTTKLPE